MLLLLASKLPLLSQFTESDFSNLMGECRVSIPLMHHWAQTSIPIVHFKSLVVHHAPFRQWNDSHRSHIINDTPPLIPHDDFSYCLGICQLVGVIQIIVKSLVTALHVNMRFVPFVHHGSQVHFHSNLFAHGRSGTNGRFVGQNLLNVLAVSPFQPLAILGRLSQSSCICIFLSL